MHVQVKLQLPKAMQETRWKRGWLSVHFVGRSIGGTEKHGQKSQQPIDRQCGEHWMSTHGAGGASRGRFSMNWEGGSGSKRNRNSSWEAGDGSSSSKSGSSWEG